MQLNQSKLLAAIASITKSPQLLQAQQDSVKAILAECAANGVIDIRQIAYILATCWHESRLRPIEEIGRGKGLPYGGKLDMGRGPGKRVPYTTPDKLFYGRGLVQITWLSNYRSFSKIIGADLVNNPERVLETPIAAKIAVIGMKKGIFTGRYLAQFFNDHTEDPIEARTIINGHDCAITIKSYYLQILKGLQP